MAQKPRHDADGSYCPRWRKKCSDVCHICEFWMELSVVNLVTHERDTIWNCATKWQAMLAVDIKQQTVAAGAETASLHKTIASRMDDAQGARAARLSARPDAVLLPTLPS
jgi:hypothetical protein